MTPEWGNLYLGNKMMGRPFMNASWFDWYAEALRKVQGVRIVFNPAEEDRKNGFDPMKCPNGTAEEALAAGFVLRDTLGADWSWIARFSDGMLAGPEWRDSPGAISEVACHNALRLPVWSADRFLMVTTVQDGKSWQERYDALMDPSSQIKVF